MVSVKERTVKGTKYLYVSCSTSYKGRKIRFEKSLGPSSKVKDNLRLIEFHSTIIRMKCSIYRAYLEAKTSEFEHLPQFYAFYLAMIRQGYHNYLEDLYPDELEKYQDEFDTRYVHNTNAIEGNTLTLRETALVLGDGIAPKGKMLREIHEVENYQRLLRFVRSYDRDISMDFILKQHELIQRNIDDENGGKLRRIPVHIKGADWEPPPALLVKDELKDLIEWYVDNRDDIHPFELAGIFHHRFVQIHPFVDGNGRVARELLNFILRKNDYPPLIVPVSERQEYMDCLEKADGGDPEPLIEFFAIQIIQDYMKVIFSYKDHISRELGRITPEEGMELAGMMLWFATLIREFQKDVPDRAQEKLGSVLRELILSDVGKMKEMGLITENSGADVRD
ncbi:MAG: Fic family protein [Thermoplasmatota archaeon]